jgi:hypothetical protein
VAYHAHIPRARFFYLEQAVTDTRLVHFDAEEIQLGGINSHFHKVIAVAEPYLHSHRRVTVKKICRLHRLHWARKPIDGPKFLQRALLTRGKPARTQDVTFNGAVTFSIVRIANVGGVLRAVSFVTH